MEHDSNCRKLDGEWEENSSVAEIESLSLIQRPRCQDLEVDQGCPTLESLRGSLGNYGS